MMMFFQILYIGLADAVTPTLQCALMKIPKIIIRLIIKDFEESIRLEEGADMGKVFVIS